MAVSINNIHSGQADNVGTSGVSSGNAGTISTSGDAQVVILIFATSRSDTVTNQTKVNSVSAGGLTFVEVTDRLTEFNVGGAFPLTNWHLQVFAAPALAQITNLSWSTTNSASFANHQACIGFAVAGIGNYTHGFDGDVAGNAATSFFASNTDTSLELPSVNITTSDANTLLLSVFVDSVLDADGNPGAQSAGSGWTAIANLNTGRQYSVGNLFAQYKNVTATQSAAAQTPGSNRKFWQALTLAFTESGTNPASAERVTQEGLEVLYAGASVERVTAIGAEVLYAGVSAERVTAIGLEVLRSVDVAAAVEERVTQIGLETLYTAASAERVTQVGLEVLRSAENYVAPPVDGKRFLEAAFNAKGLKDFEEADFDSIYSQGDRIANGLITSDFAGFTTFGGSFPASHFNDSYAFPFGDGMAISSNPVPGGSYWYMDFGGTPVNLRGFRLIGTEDIDDSKQWILRGGYSHANIAPEPYPAEFDTFACSQLTALTGGYAGLKYTDFEFSPRVGVYWPYYEFVSAFTQPIGQVRFCNEMWLKVAHSILDGGDRRASNGRPAKQVQLNLGPGVDFRDEVSGGFYPPNDALIDGQVRTHGSPSSGTDRKSSIWATVGNGPLNTAGLYLEFIFPRNVVFKHFVLETSVQETYTGSVPDGYGVWHWEVSDNSGVTWRQVGSSWSFKEACTFMIAPRTGAFSFSRDALTGVGEKGLTHWRMVLESGPAFGGAMSLSEIIFDLEDEDGQTIPLSVAFSDDTDNVLPVPEIGPAGNPYEVAFSDGDDDKLEVGTPVNIPNPLLSVAFSDGDSDALEAFSDLFPSIVVQTIVVATGRT